MCTSLTLKTKDNCHFLGRTMDFAMDFNQCPLFIPRKYPINNFINDSIYKTKYAVLGMGTILNKTPILADGLNEEGLACATLYLPGFAKYDETTEKNTFGIAPYDFILWILSNFKSINEVKFYLDKIRIIDKELSLLKITPPLHWILTDKSGNSIVIEKTEKEMNVFDNPVGVMTNSPDFKWHLTNLRQYISINPSQHKDTIWNGLNLSPFSQGTGTFGLPGDFTPPSRFIRAAFLKNNLTHIDNEHDGVTGIFHILSSCNIPKGIVLKDDKSEDFTIYTSSMCVETGNYYYSTYENRQIIKLSLFNEDLNSKKIKQFLYKREEHFFEEN